MNKTKALLAFSAVTFPLAGYIYLGKTKHGLVRLLAAYAVFFVGRIALGMLEALPVTDLVAAAYFAGFAGYVLLVIFVIKWIVEDMFAIHESKSQPTETTTTAGP